MNWGDDFRNDLSRNHDVILMPTCCWFNRRELPSGWHLCYIEIEIRTKKSEKRKRRKKKPGVHSAPIRFRAASFSSFDMRVSNVLVHLDARPDELELSCSFDDDGFPPTCTMIGIVNAIQWNISSIQVHCMQHSYMCSNSDLIWCWGVGNLRRERYGRP
jgi:hypothetical protein